MSDTAWTWHELGSAFVVDMTAEGWLWVEITSEPEVDRAGCAVELPPRAVVELTEWLDSVSENGLGQRLAEVEAECAAIEAERDAVLAALDRLRAALRALPDSIEATR